jgi:hypothetical protein
MKYNTSLTVIVVVVILCATFLISTCTPKLIESDDQTRRQKHELKMAELALEKAKLDQRKVTITPSIDCTFSLTPGTLDQLASLNMQIVNLETLVSQDYRFTKKVHNQESAPGAVLEYRNKGTQELYLFILNDSTTRCDYFSHNETARTDALLARVWLTREGDAWGTSTQDSPSTEQDWATILESLQYCK